MEVFKIDVTSWTASFRYPNIISGFQPSLEVPPISTVLGLINAASGNYQEYKRLILGYYFEFQAKAIDLETIYQIQNNNGAPTNNAKSNVIKREFLIETSLRIYLVDEYIAHFFLKPYYPIVLGRMNDLATIQGKIEKKTLTKVPKAEKIRGQIVPFTNYHLPGQIQALPKYFTNNFPRNNLGTEAYSVINCKNNVAGNFEAFRDPEKEVDIYFHQLDFS